ncbi:hypothetical protein C8R11_102259 [Nitrosomonas aestuarii]|nr:hypothetical protein C8R11_102259 [Nitrosomonas aestuarii]
MDAIKTAQRARDGTIGIELISGLPRQSIKNFNYTLDRIVIAEPDIFNFARL